MLNTNITPTVGGVFSIKPTETQLMNANANGGLKKAFDFGMDLYNWKQDLNSANMLEENEENLKADEEAAAAQNSEMDDLKAQLAELKKQKAELEAQEQNEAYMNKLTDAYAQRMIDMQEGNYNNGIDDKNLIGSDIRLLWNWAK